MPSPNVDSLEHLIAALTRRLWIAVVVLTVLLGGLIGWPLLGNDRAFLWPVVALLGSIGAFISVQRRLKQLAEPDLRLLATGPWYYASLAPVVGGLLASLLYTLFLSGVLAGQLFPAFHLDPKMVGKVSGLGMLSHMMSDAPEDYAKLLFWSFVAGYSESFVVDVIGRFENRPNP